MKMRPNTGRYLGTLAIVFALMSCTTENNPALPLIPNPDAGVTDSGTLPVDTTEQPDVNGDVAEDASLEDVLEDGSPTDGFVEDSTNLDVSPPDISEVDTSVQDALTDTNQDVLPSDVTADTLPDDVESADAGLSEDAVEPMPGDGLSCATAYELKNPPIQVVGDTSAFSPSFSFGAGECPGEAGGWGLASPDVAYMFVPTETAVYSLTLEANFDSVLYVATDCSDIASTCLAANDLIGVGAVETVVLDLEANVPVFVLVDGYSNTNPLAGTYTLDLSGPCTPQCAEGACTDGCGGPCPCADGLTCNPINGLCETGVGGNTCEQASVIVDLPFAALGDTGTGYSDSYSVAGFVCNGLPLGGGFGSNDAVFRFTPKKTTVYSFAVKPDPGFDVSVYIAGDCSSLSATCVGGADDVGPGSQENLSITLEKDVTYYVIVDGAGPSISGGFAIGLDLECQPTCTEGLCGDDGCGSVCPCGDGESCIEGACCAPVCDGLTCSDDGCGGVCPCAPGTLCEEASSTCIDAPVGDQCANPFIVDAGSLPALLLGTTVDFKNNYAYGDNTCSGEPSGWGAGSSDVTYALTPTIEAIYEIALSPFGDFDATLYVVQDCQDTANTCLGASEVFQGVPGEKAESLTLSLKANVTYYIVVDGFANESNVTGNFQLSVSAPCFPECTPGLCGGPDGCGSLCGCDEGKLCHPQTKACVASMGGNVCADATSIPPLSAAAGDTTLAEDTYGVDPGACPGIDGDGGYGSADHTYSMTPTVTGVYPITLESDFDGILYAVKNCGNVADSCLAGVDDVAEGDTETLFLTASANQEYFIVVDGFGLGSEGVYLLNIGAPCILECPPGTCGSDGCGGQCQCSIGQTCNAGLCE